MQFDIRDSVRESLIGFSHFHDDNIRPPNYVSVHSKKYAHLSFLPEASFGLRVLSSPASVGLCVRVCVYQSRACPHDNSSPIQARITKLGPEMQNTLVWVPIVFGDDRPWSLRSNLTWKSNFTHFELVHPITHQPFKLESPNLDRKCILALSRSLLILDFIGCDLHFHFQSWNLFFYQIYLGPFCIY